MSLEKIKERLQNAEKFVGRKVGSTQLIAVSKVQPEIRVLSVLHEGHRCFGENRVQEAMSKWPEFSENEFQSILDHYSKIHRKYGL